MFETVKSFRRNDSGQFAMMTALIGIPLLIAVGLGLDYNRTLENKSHIQSAVDTAVMAAAVSYSTSYDTETAIAEGKKVFEANCIMPDCENNKYPTFTITPGVSVTASYDALLDTVLMQMGGIKQVTFNIQSDVNLAYRYQEYYFAVDRSGSTGIAADDTNIAALRAISKNYYSFAPNGCAFACHVPDGNEPYGTNKKQMSLYDVAKENNIKLREDVLMDAVSSAASTILEMINGTHADQIKVGAYAFSDKLVTLTKPTANSTNLIQQIKNDSTTPWGTRFDVVMPDLTTAVGKSGTGLTKKDPEKTLVLITDGFETNYMWGDSDSKSWYKAFSSSYCSTLKSNGVRVVVIDVEYPRLTGDSIYESFAAPVVNNISPALKACASDGFYYKAGETAQIQATLIKMSKDVMRAKLTFTR